MTEENNKPWEEEVYARIGLMLYEVSCADANPGSDDGEEAIRSFVAFLSNARQEAEERGRREMLEEVGQWAERYSGQGRMWENELLKFLESKLNQSE